MAFLTFIAIMCALIGAAVATVGVMAANGAPQEAAAAVIGIAWAVIPYCVVRLAEERRRDLKAEMAEANRSSPAAAE